MLADLSPEILAMIYEYLTHDQKNLSLTCWKLCEVYRDLPVKYYEPQLVQTADDLELDNYITQDNDAAPDFVDYVYTTVLQQLSGFLGESFARHVKF